MRPTWPWCRIKRMFNDGTSLGEWLGRWVEDTPWTEAGGVPVVALLCRAHRTDT